MAQCHGQQDEQLELLSEHLQGDDDGSVVARETHGRSCLALCLQIVDLESPGDRVAQTAEDCVQDLEIFLDQELGVADHE